jgi:hypothetical protein
LLRCEEASEAVKQAPPNKIFGKFSESRVSNFFRISKALRKNPQNEAKNGQIEAKTNPNQPKIKRNEARIGEESFQRF